MLFNSEQIKKEKESERGIGVRSIPDASREGQPVRNSGMHETSGTPGTPRSEQGQLFDSMDGDRTRKSKKGPW